MRQDGFFYNRGQLHSDLARWISDAPTRAKPQGELRTVHDFVTRNNGLSQTAAFEVTIPFSGLFNQRSLQASTGTVGGYLISTVLTGFEPILRNVLVLGRAGVQILSNLSSNLSFPKQITANTFSYLAEGATAPSSDQAFGQLACTPRRFSGTASFSKQLFKQAPQIQAEQFDSFARDALAESERAAIQGTGQAQPLGIINTPGVNQITFSAAATLQTLELYEQGLAQKNVDLARVCFLMDPLTLGKFRQIARGSSKFLVDESSAYQAGISVLGYPAYCSQNVPASTLIAGDFTKSTMCFFGSGDDPPVTLTLDPFSSKRQEQIEVTLDMRQDFVARQVTAFCTSSGSTTQ